MITLAKQICFLTGRMQVSNFPEDKAILDSLRRLQAIESAEMPEPVEHRYRYDWPYGGDVEDVWVTGNAAWHHQMPTDCEPLYGPELRTYALSQKERADRLLSLLREPSRELLTDCARRLLRFQDDSTDESFSGMQWAAARQDAARVLSEAYARVADVRDEK